MLIDCKTKPASSYKLKSLITLDILKLIMHLRVREQRNLN